jgi:UDP-glucose 4-epimerase
MQRDCLNPYSVTKAGAEDLCKMYYTLYGLETIIFRYFNVYGNRQPTKGQYAPVIGLFLKAVKQGKPMTVVGDGLQTRDFCNVLDVVRANILAATASRGLGEVHNIGTGESYSVLDIANMIGDQIEHISARPGEAKDTLANVQKARDNLNWTPEINLEDWLDENK